MVESMSIDRIERIMRMIDETIDRLMASDLNEFYDIEKRELKPLTQIIETEDEVIVSLDLPCASKDNLEVKGTEDMLVIRAKMSNKVRIEDLNTEFDCYSKNIRLPSKVDPRRASARFSNGVLQVRLPKKNEGREINVE